jgi:hypothetical protein
VRRLGISVSADTVRAVLVSAGRVVWHSEATIDERTGTSAALDRLLSRVPRTRWRRTSVRVAIGLAHSHVKRIEGLPPARQTKLLDRIVSENAEALFLRVGTRTLTTRVERLADGSVLAAALDAAIVDDALAACRRRRLSPSVFLPHTAAVSHAIPAGAWRISDSGRSVELTTVEGPILQDCRRGVGAASDALVPPVPPPLTSIGAGALASMAAYGAALWPPRAPFAWTPGPSPTRVRSFERARVLAASIAFLAATSAALFARGARASRTARAATTVLATFRTAEIEAARIDAELRQVTTELNRLREFDGTRGRVTLLLGTLSEALPDSTAVVSLHVDSLEGSFVALTPHAAAVLPPLFELAGVIAPRIVGSVTRETQNGASVERASIRFRRVRTGVTRAPAVSSRGDGR